MAPSGTALQAGGGAFNPLRYTRAASRVRTRGRARLRDTALDVYTALLTAGTIGAYAAGLVLALREQVARAVDTGAAARTLVDAPWLSVPAGTAPTVLLFAALLTMLPLARKLGPAAVTAAEGYWWLSLPLERRPLLIGRLIRRLALSFAAASVLYWPFGFITDPSATAGGQVRGAVTFGLAAAGTVLLAALHQAGARPAGAGGPPGRLEVTGSLVLLAGLSLLPRLAAGGPLWPPVAAAAVVGGLAALLSPRLGRISGRELIRGGAVSGHAGGALFLMDANELGRALAGGGPAGVSARGRRWYAKRPRTPIGALLRADLVAFLRAAGWWVRPVLLLMLCLALLVTGGLQAMPLQLAVIAVTVCAVVPVFGVVARQTAITPGLDRLLPLSPAAVRLSRLAPPAAALALWAAVFCGALVLLGAGSPALIGLGALAGIGLGASAVRGAYRPQPDWSAPPVETAFGPVPTAQAGAMFQGLDTTLAALVPLLLGLFLGSVPAALLLAQAAVSAACVLMAMYARK